MAMEEPEDGGEGFEPIGRATYSPEDNKLRIYPEGVRVDSVLDETQYANFKKAGYKWASKQDCFVCPRWTPTAEDWALRLCGEIEDEDYSALERSADRAERFSDYRDKRADEAGAKADAFDAGPSAFGHQSRARAERQARRHDRYRVGAVSQWSKAEYWQSRTAGVISHALHRADPRVRRGRIKTIETDLRKHLKSLEECQRRYDSWRMLKDAEGADVALPADGDAKLTAVQAKAYMLAGDGHCWVHFYHPTCEAANARAREIWKHGFSPYELLTKQDFGGLPFEKLTPRQVAELYTAHVCDPSTPGKSWHRWTAHYELRLTYERAMLANEGGTAAAVEIEPGGWFGRLQVQKVNKSAATGRVVSVGVIGPHPWKTNDDGTPKICVQSVNIERLPEGAYKPPTDEEREEFKAKKKAEKDAKTPCPTINPTPEAAAKLQANWNEWIKAKRPDSKPSKVEEMTQKQFSRALEYSSAIAELSADGRQVSSGGAFKVRLIRRHWGGADSVVILTDKPQKPLPLVETASPGLLFAVEVA